jgi:MYXO-CTERM domain-containing protein
MHKPTRHVLAFAIALAACAFSAPAFAHEACEGDTDCAEGEVCHDGECSVSCTADEDCPEEQTCSDSVCLHADDAGHEDEGCSAGSSTPPGESLPFVALALLAVPFARRRR